MRARRLRDQQVTERPRYNPRMTRSRLAIMLVSVATLTVPARAADSASLRAGSFLQHLLRGPSGCTAHQARGHGGDENHRRRGCGLECQVRRQRPQSANRTVLHRRRAAPGDVLVVTFLKLETKPDDGLLVEALLAPYAADPTAIAARVDRRTEAPDLDDRSRQRVSPGSTRPTSRPAASSCRSGRCLAAASASHRREGGHLDGDTGALRRQHRTTRG